MTAALARLGRRLGLLVVVSFSIVAGALAAGPHVVEPTEAEMRAEYDRARTNWAQQLKGQKEYDVRHILVTSEAEAQAALGRIAGGEKFEVVARGVSRDPGSAAKGGSLGWSLPTHFVEPFADAMTKLGPAGLSREPVRSPFGWHVIEVLAVREPVFPEYERVKDRVRAALLRAQEQWQLYDASGIYAREVDQRSIVVRGDKTFFQYRERMVRGSQPERTARVIPAVADCARNERADMAADGSFEMRPIFPDTAQARQLQFVCEHAMKTAGHSARPAPQAADSGLSCDGPAPTFPADMPKDRRFTGATVVVRGEVTAPAGAIGEVFVESPSGFPTIDDAAVNAFRAMRCKTREPLQAARWVRKSFVFEPKPAN